MAALLQVTIAPATQDQFNELDARVGQAMMEAGGPPDGMMSHVVYPEADGFVIAQVWRDEATGRAYAGEVLRRLLDDLGLPSHQTTALPVWSFARP